ncbi:MAG: preprotein translocase subunit SecG [Bacteroidales bacterium]|nr:preprotein translocase subunit SecG [Bacteroidales bacterium]
MYTLAVILILLASLILILIVLVQNPKGGGLASGFTGANQFGGVAQTNKFLEKTTWTLAVVILGLSLFATISLPKQEIEQSDLTEVINTTDFNSAPVNPVQINPADANDPNADQ